MKKNGLRLLRRRMQDLLKTVNDGRLSNKNQSQLTVASVGLIIWPLVVCLLFLCAK